MILVVSNLHTLFRVSVTIILALIESMLLINRTTLYKVEAAV